VRPRRGIGTTRPASEPDKSVKTPRLRAAGFHSAARITVDASWRAAAPWCPTVFSAVLAASARDVEDGAPVSARPKLGNVLLLRVTKLMITKEPARRDRFSRTRPVTIRNGRISHGVRRFITRRMAACPAPKGESARRRDARCLSKRRRQDLWRPPARATTRGPAHRTAETKHRSYPPRFVERCCSWCDGQHRTRCPIARFALSRATTTLRVCRRIASPRMPRAPRAMLLSTGRRTPLARRKENNELSPSFLPRNRRANHNRHDRRNRHRRRMFERQLDRNPE